MGSLKYIIAMDFKATCDSDKTEIVEFPAVLINLRTGDIEAQFQKYVRPTKNLNLSSYRRQLTGIGENDIKNAGKFPKVLSEFFIWLKDVLERKSLKLPKRSRTGPFDCIFVTWGSDFERFLVPECERKNLSKPNYFNYWCDLQDTFSKRYGGDSSTLRNAMSSLHLSFSGREHCGLDDATNIARLAYTMHKRGVGLELRIYSTKIMGSLKYIVAMDFEATCDSDKTEIIEFPAVLMNLRTGDIESRFRRYVRPTENPILSSFCRQLTGIEQYDVNHAGKLSKVLADFISWLNDVLRLRSLKLPKRSRTGPFDCIFVTWGSDFERFLAPECKRKNISKPNYFNYWCDLQNIFSKRYGGGSSTLRNAISSLDLSFSGREHCGLDDATNTAKLVYAMHKGGIGLELLH